MSTHRSEKRSSALQSTSSSKKRSRAVSPPRTEDEDEWVEKEEAVVSGTGVTARADTGDGRRGADDRDFFGSLGQERKRKDPKEKLDPSQTMGQSSRELNKAHWQQRDTQPVDGPSATTPAALVPGSAGSAWRMTKVRRTYEVAREEGRDLEEVALERYGSLDEWRGALEEERILGERSSRRSSGGSSGPLGAATGRRFVYHELPRDDAPSAGSSRPPSRGSFRKPGDTLDRTMSPSSRPSTPVPNVFTPPLVRTPRPAAPSTLSQSVPLPLSSTAAAARPPLTQSDLNKLQAKVLKAKLLGNPDAEAMEREYEGERVRTLAVGVPGAGGQGTAEVLPTLDGRGRLYDVGTGTEDAVMREPGQRKPKEKHFATHDVKTGEVLRLNADDDALSLSEMVRQERFSGGAQDQKDMDHEIASHIAGDTKYQNNLDYVDENADRLARKKVKSEILKKSFAVNDYARTKKALDECPLCFGDEGQAPRAGVIALGTRAYLALTETEPLVPGHCRIVPLQHHFSSLEADDETWDEIKNFMKTLMRMFASQDRGVIFFESCITLRHQKHTTIEVLPLPFALFDEIPAYFQEAIDSSEQEWSQNKKRIVFTPARPFRRSLVPNLPYFAVQWDYKGEKGYGHIIEGVDDAPDLDADGEVRAGDIGEKGGGAFPRWFATEIVGSMLELEPRLWRKPRRLDPRENKRRVAAFVVDYAAFDWTVALV